ncbi:MAG: nickel pincer cofactor biosynthesis protein LarC [Planctomycetota bacterium]
MGAILWFDMFSGISGDMVAGAFLDLGLDRRELAGVLGALPVAGEFRLAVRRRTIGGIRGTDFCVHPVHPHGHDHARGHDGHHRTMRDIARMLNAAPLPPRTRRLAIDIFTVLAKAEGRVHGVPWPTVHFHEVGAVDSIVDIVTAAFAVDRLDITACHASPFRLGTGTVRTQHGLLPVPPPAVAELVRGLAVAPDDTPMELTTPTGAAIVRTLVRDPGPPAAFTVTATGYGCGKRERTGLPNLLRLVLGAPAAAAPGDGEVIELVTDIDDATPQTVGYLFEKLLEAGALDCTAAAVVMKKNRPGTRLTVLTDAAHAAALRRVLFVETPTFGIREHAMRRTVLDRGFVTVDLPEGPVRCKVGRFEGRVVTVTPEYEDCRAIARAAGRPLRAVQAAAAELARTRLAAGRRRRAAPPKTTRGRTA